MPLYLLPPSPRTISFWPKVLLSLKKKVGRKKTRLVRKVEVKRDGALRKATCNLRESPGSRAKTVAVTESVFTHWRVNKCL